ncbi:MAG: DUF58 domain-containing protein [Anaerolineales bacterium]|jgi:uncharacterized protein (DUF58 family)
MPAELLLPLLLMLLLAAFVRSGFALTVLYLLLGAYLLGWFLSQQARKKINYRRTLDTRAFTGEDIPVQLDVENNSWLPVPWLHLYESLPVELAAGLKVRRVVSLLPHSHAAISYSLHATKRGFYPVGPLFTAFGDTLGLVEIQEFMVPADHLTVYPKIIPLTHTALPSQSPQGSLRHHQPIFEDPTRLLRKRDYTSGDSLRHVDWKATAVVGRLQVKQYEPSIALETMIFLNLNTAEYLARYVYDSSELAIVIAASLANWITSKKQAVGLIANGSDPASEDRSYRPLPSRKGQEHLMQILDVLARVQIGERTPLIEILRNESPRLPWGTTLIIITGQVNDAFFDELFQIERRGQNVVLILAGYIGNASRVREQASSLGIQVHLFQTEKDLDAWRL